MKRPVSLAVAACLAAGWLAPVASHAQLAPYVVQLQNSRFNPSQLEIPVGATVQWVARESGHTVSASDYRFDWEPNRTLTAGETREWTFTEDETFRYQCRIHAPAMSGIITVGLGSPPPPPPPDVTGDSRNVPSTEFPTMDAALVDLPRDSEIVLQPGVYPPFDVEVNEVLIRGTGVADDVVVDGSVVIDGGSIAKTGIHVLGDDVRLRGLSVRNVADDPVLIEGDDARLSHLSIQSGLASAIRARGASRVVIEDSIVTGAPAINGIVLERVYDALIQRSTVNSARTGIIARESVGIVVRDSTLAGNGTGIALRSMLGAGVPLVDGRTFGAHLIGNQIRATNGPVFGLDPSLDLITGAGIWLDATWSVLVERNTITTSNTYGVAATGLFGPTIGLQIRDNLIPSARTAAVGWDGLGTACVSGASPTEPPTLAMTNDCANGPRPGLPHPKVDIDLLTYAAVGPV